MSRVDLIVPTVAGRELSLERCLSSFEARSDDLTAIIVRDSPTCGQGWIEGLERSTAPYVLLACDDQECASSVWAEVCIEAADEGLLPCPRVYTPGGMIESQGGDMNAPGHLITRHRKDRSPCDFTVVPFMSREQVERIGMLPVHYGSDVWVSYRGRQLGYETVLVHGFDLIHHQEQIGRGAGMTQNERDAMDCETVFAELKETATA